MYRRVLQNFARDRLVATGEFKRESLTVIFLSKADDYYYYLVKAVGHPPYLLKTCEDSKLEGPLLKEGEVLKMLSLSTHTPNIYMSLPSSELFKHPILLMEYAPGRELQYEKDYLKVGQMFGGIHRFSRDILDLEHKNPIISSLNESKEALKDALASGVFSVEHLYFFEGFLEWAEEEAEERASLFDPEEDVITHGVLKETNFSVDHNAMLFDWTDAHYSHPAKDIAHFFSKTTSLWNSNFSVRAIDKEDFYYLYGKARGTSINELDNFVRAYMPYHYLKVFSAFAHYFYEVRDPQTPIMNPTFHKKVLTFLEVDTMQRIVRDCFY
ncbi:phosphotransferase [Guggenheimella bovis]